MPIACFFLRICSEKLVKLGLMKDDEAEHLLSEEIQSNIDRLLSCNEKDHPGEMQISDDQMPIDPDRGTAPIPESPDEGE